VARVLVVEDDPSIRELVVYALGDEGHEVEEAADGSIALELVARRRPDVIILDMKMPGMDGWQFARTYRERHGARTPIIVFTAATDAAGRAAEVGAEAFVAKPFDLEALIERVQTMTSRAEPD
jgi:two-component system response regulator MprA